MNHHLSWRRDGQDPILGHRGEDVVRIALLGKLVLAEKGALDGPTVAVSTRMMYYKNSFHNYGVNNMAANGYN